MLLDEVITLKWNSRNKNRYVSLGYEFTKMKDPFKVKLTDVTDSCMELVSIKCDYCGYIYQKPWHRYLMENVKSTINKDCCNKCKKYKIIETSRFKYGVDSVLSLESVRDKAKSTNIEKYGCENVFASDEIKEKIKETNIKKYGFSSPLKNQDIKDKARNTCLERYGRTSYGALYSETHTKELSPTWKGGVEYHRVERSSFEYIEWRKSVFRRDSFQCVCCGAKNGITAKNVKLHAHHKFNWKDNESLRYDVENGVTLCDKCHYGFHSIYGKSNNTDKQLDEFLLNHGKKVC